MRKISRQLVIGATAALLRVSGAVAGIASATPANSGTISVSGFYKEDLGNGKFVAWASTDYLREHPQPIAGINTKFSADGVTPLDASGCNFDVCIDLEGDGTYVNTWGTQAFGNHGCQNAIFESPYGTDFSQPPVCPYSPSEGVYYDYTGPIGYFGDGSVLCDEWTSFDGKPCETVHN